MSNSDRTRTRASTPESRPIVVLSNVYSDSNLGGAAITEETARFATRIVPRAHVVLIRVSPGDVEYGASKESNSGGVEAPVSMPPLIRATGGLRTVTALIGGLLGLLIPRTISRFRRDLRVVADASLVVSKGGYLFGYRTGWRSLLGLLAASYPLLLAARRGVPTIAYSTSVGPFSGPLHRWLVGLLLRRLTVVAVRDADSERRVSGLRVRSDHVVLMPDCVVGWDGGLDYGSAPGSHPDRLTIVVRDLPKLRLTLDNLEQALVASSHSGIFTEFQVVMQSVEDREFSQTFAKRLQSMGLDVIYRAPAEIDPRAAVRLYQDAAATVSFRLHGAIFSLLAGVPSIVIPADPGKVEGVFDELGIPGMVLFPDSDPGTILQMLTACKRPDTTIRISAQLERARERLLESESRIRSILEHSSEA